MPKKGRRKKLLQQAGRGQAGASGSGQPSTQSEHESTEGSGVRDGRGDEKNSTSAHQPEGTEPSEKRISFSAVAAKSATASCGSEAFPQLPEPDVPRTVATRGGPVFTVDGEQYCVKENVGTEKVMVLATASVDKNAQRPMRSPSKETKSGCREIQVLANYFRVGIDTSKFPKIVYHYDVVITLKKLKESEGASNELKGSTVPDRHLPLIWREFEKKFHKVLGARLPFDGKKNCYSAKKLNFKEGAAWVGEIEMTDPDDDDKRRVYRIQLKEAGDGGIRTCLMWEYLKTCETFQRVDFPQEVIQALDVVLRYSAECAKINFTLCNRRLYFGSNPHPISELLELWFGHIQSLTLGRDQQVYLNVDMANKAFTKRMKVADILRNIQNKKDKFLSDGNIAVGNEFLKGKLVQYTTTEQENGEEVNKHHRFICQGIKADSSAAAFKFTVKKTQKETTIAEYFREDKNIRLDHPDWPVVHLGNSKMNNHVPLELLEIIPQAYKGELSPQNTSAIISGAAKPPDKRFERIQKSRKDCDFEKCPILEEFGMSVGDEKVEVNDAKRLLPPDIKCGNTKPVSRQELLKADGKFKLYKSLKPAKVPPIAVMNVSGIRDLQAIKHFLSELGKKATALGLSGGKLFSNAKIFDKVSSQCEVHNCLKTLKDNSIKFVIVIMGRDGNEYNIIKRVAERQDGVGILTQCVKWGTVENAKPDVLGKILCKINVKLNGQNFELGKEVMNELKFLQEPIMFLGADVTHPDANSKSPSVAAITASYDISGMCYQMHIQQQPKKDGAQEVISINQFAEIIKKMIETYHMRTDCLPKRIIMFRDGVSEGQFKEIKKKEFEEGIQLACKTLADRFTIPPMITFIVVKKRHHTRFCPSVNSKDVVKPKPQDNISPGTVVDTVITHPTDEEFYLNSHVGIKGTSKPSRYHVIHDDSKLTMDQLEKLSYYLCYTYQRCTQPVSYPAPTYYAHLAAFRARALLENEGDNANIEALENKMVVHPELQKYPMFYI